jgi:hypothetical protein
VAVGIEGAAAVASEESRGGDLRLIDAGTPAPRGNWIVVAVERRRENPKFKARLAKIIKEDRELLESFAR